MARRKGYWAMALLFCRAVSVLRGAGAAFALVLIALAPAHAEGKALHGIALVIGQSDYENIGKLTNPANDAKAIDRLLTDLGFEVDLVSNADRRKLTKSLSRFVEDAADADVALIYYSGHGIEAGGENFLVPIDADVSSLGRAGETLVPVSRVIAELQATVPVTVVLLDACRSNPFPAGTMVKVDDDSPAVPLAAGGLGAPRGVVALGGKGTGQNGGSATDSLGTVIGFAAAPGHVAMDGAPNGNSPYATALIEHLAAPGFTFSDVMTMVSEEVYLKTGAQQQPWTNASLRRLLYFGGAAEDDSDGDQSAIRGERRQLLLTIATLDDVERQQVVAKSRDDGVPMDALFAMLKAVGADIPQDPDDLGKLLEEQSVRLKGLLDERAEMRNADPEIARLSGLANEAVTQGALAAAIGFRERAKARVVELSSTVDNAEAELKAKRIEFAAVFADSAETYALAYDNARAAEDFGKAYEQVAKWDDTLALEYKLKQAAALADLGFYKADADANRRAIAAYQEAAALAPAETNPAGWADAQTGIAMALWGSGSRAAGTDDLDKAAALLKAAIASPALAAKPGQTAELQASLSLVLFTLGNREAGTEQLEEAEHYAREALKVRTRADFPNEWARLQNHLGSALYLHGLREGSNERIEEAGEAFRAALEVWTRDKDPLSWANAENNLGLAIGEIGEREAGTDKLVESIGYLKAALEVRTRDIAPLSWAESMANLGSTYFDIGGRSGDVKWYRDATAAMNEAMTEITRARDPLKWAALQADVGMAESATAVVTGDAEHLDAALASFEQALTERTRERVPLDWAATMNSIGNAYYRLGAITHDAAAYRKAADAFTAALEERTRERTEIGWAQTQNNLANALAGLGTSEEGIDSLRQAVEHYRLALEAYSVGSNPGAYAETQYNIAVTMLDIGRKTHRQEDLDAARAAAKASQDVYHAAGQMQYDQYYDTLEAGIELVEAEAIVKRKQRALADEADHGGSRQDQNQNR
jgi:uncharacterized caspase-like protein